MLLTIASIADDTKPINGNQIFYTGLTLTNCELKSIDFQRTIFGPRILITTSTIENIALGNTETIAIFPAGRHRGVFIDKVSI